MDNEWTKLLGWGKEEIEDLRLLAFTYIRQGHYQTALTFYKGITILSNQATHDLQTLGALYLQLGHFKEAMETLEKALHSEPSHLKTRLNHAKALLLSGYRQRALQELHDLNKVKDPEIASDAEALILGYSQ